MLRFGVADRVSKQIHRRWKDQRSQQERAHLAPHAGKLDPKDAGDVTYAFHQSLSVSSRSKGSPVSSKYTSSSEARAIEYSDSSSRATYCCAAAKLLQ